ncbi:ABC transporter permease [Bacteroidota bacterium]
MIKSFIKVTIRNIIRHRAFSFINIMGLTIGLATSLLIFMYVYDDISYDSFHENGDDIYRVCLKARLSDQGFETPYTSPPVGDGLSRELPEIASFCRIATWDNVPVRYEEDIYTEKEMLLADSNFFQFFSFETIHGDPATMLKGPNQIVLTESTARKYFGWEGEGDYRPLGKIMNIGTGQDVYTVSGIIKDAPHNSHIGYDIIVSMESWKESQMPVWANNCLINYISLHSQADWQVVESKFGDVVRKYFGPIVQQAMGITIDQFYENGGEYELFLQPMQDIYLYSDLENDVSKGGNILYIYILVSIALFIVLIACINFMNLSTARFAERAKEVGVRKTLGAVREKLVAQFIGESVVLSMIGMVLALALVSGALSQFNLLSGKELTIGMLRTPYFILGIGLLIIISGVLAGSYPALYLTAFKPTDVLRGKVKAGLKSGGIRNGLVIFQFTISIAMIISTVFIYKQLTYLQNKELGFDKENVVILNNADGLGLNKNAFIDALKRQSEISGISVSSHVPPDVNYSDLYKPVNGSEKEVGMTYYFADPDHLKTLGFKMVQGRFFSYDFPSDSSAVVINEAAARLIGWDDPLGQKINTVIGTSSEDAREIIGVVKDFHFQSLHDEINPLVIFPGSDGDKISIRLIGGNVFNELKMIEEKWKAMAENAPFEFSFIDQEFDAKFRAEQRLGKIFLLFTTFAILVAALGLFGLATFTAEQRAKEIGVRKAMGASVFSIIRMLSTEYTKLVLISFIIAVPVTWFVISSWLENFAFKTSMSSVVFIIGGLIALFIAWVTVGYRCYRAATKNPVNSLRYE